MIFMDSQNNFTEPDDEDEVGYDDESDIDEAERERELLTEELGAYNDDFSRSSDEGWFYSDED